jgi:hypothetical protein
MATAARAFLLALLSLTLPGCYVKIHAVETSGGGAHATTTSSQVAGSAKFSHGSAGFSSGPRVSPGSPGGQVSFGKGASAVLIVGLVVADLFNYIAGPAAPKPLPPGERIMDTCSCYQKQGTGNREQGTGSGEQ